MQQLKSQTNIPKTLSVKKYQTDLANNDAPEDLTNNSNNG